MRSCQARRFSIAHDIEKGLFVRRFGDLDGETAASRGTLFYIHGLGESALCFERLMTEPALAAWDHFAPDLAGYGKSPWSADPLSLAAHARRLGQFLDYFDGGPIVLVGHSMGGVIGTLMAEQQPGRLAGFVNVEGNISLPDCAYSSRAAACSFDEWLVRGYADLLDGLYEDQREAPTVLRPYCASIQMCDPRVFYLNSEELVAMSSEETLAGRMAALDLPARCYIFGAPRGAGDQSRALLAEADVEMVGIPDSGHWPFLDQHEAFVDELRLFLERVVNPE